MGLAAAGMVGRPAAAAPDGLAAEMAEFSRGVVLRSGRVTLEIASLVDNGNTVPMTVRVDSPMTAADHVRAIHVFNEKNPQPHVLDARLGPPNGKAFLATRIKLADAQKVVAIAEMSDGTFWRASAEVIVTLAACIEDLT